MNREDMAGVAREIRGHYPDGRIYAVKILRDRTGLGLAELKSIVDRLWAECAGAKAGGFLDDDFVIGALDRAGVSFRPLGIEPEDSRPPAPPDAAALTREIRQYFPKRKIEAIKHIRGRTGLGLKEAKDIADAAWVTLGKSDTSPPGGGTPEYEVKSSGIPLIAWVAIVLLLAALAVAWLR